LSAAYTRLNLFTGVFDGPFLGIGPDAFMENFPATASFFADERRKPKSDMW
jgi:hypothetical protein